MLLQIAETYSPQLALWYNSSSKADKLAAAIAQDFGVRVQAYKVDVRQYEAVEKAVDQVVQDFGRLDVMVANAGVPTKAGGLDDKVEDWDRVRAIDFDGAYYCFRAAGLVFRKQGHGVGIATASMSGHAANVPQEQSCYNACKAGVVSTRTVHRMYCISYASHSVDEYRAHRKFSRSTCARVCRWNGPNGEVASTPCRQAILIRKSRGTARSR